PRVVSVNRDASTTLLAWGLIDDSGVLLAQVPYATGSFPNGGHAFDYARNVIYAHVPSKVAASGSEDAKPVLHLFDTDNLTVRERIRLQEPLAGKAIFSPDMNTVYALSDSGVTVLPVGSLNSQRQV